MDMFSIGIVILVTVFAILFIMGFIPSEKVKKVTDFPVKFPEKKLTDKPYYDVAIVGAGPAGSVCGYYLGISGWKSLLLERKKFPRDKCCSDVVCNDGIEILMEMRIYDKLLKHNKAHVLDKGGLVSPGGIAITGRSRDSVGEVPVALVCKRTHLDEALAMAAKRAGADLREECSVDKATFDHETGLWTITLENDDREFSARVLVCADGADSRLATQLGLVTLPPAGACSRCYVTGGTHRLQADRMVFFNKALLPGYSALLRHPNDEMSYCCYVIPGNPDVKSDELSHWHDWVKVNDPNVSKALGPHHQMEPMVSSLRVGGVKVSYDDHVLVVGDAAGMMDPMTGEGVQYAMQGGQIAASFLEEALTHGNYDRDVIKIYHHRWMAKFGYDFLWSMLISQLIFRYPILVDAAAAAMKRKGDKYLLKLTDIMTGCSPKLYMLKPEFFMAIASELIRFMFTSIYRRIFGSKKED